MSEIIHAIEIKDLDGEILCTVDGNSLKNADLSHKDLQRANLAGLDLSGANLCGTKLNDADLFKTRLTGATLASTDFTKAKLNCAKLDHIESLGPLYFDGAELVAADFTNTAFKLVATFENAKLMRANFSGALFCNSNFKGANFSEANFSDTHFSDCDLSRARLFRCELSRMRYFQRNKIHAIASDRTTKWPRGSWRERIPWTIDLAIFSSLLFGLLVLAGIIPALRMWVAIPLIVVFLVGMQAAIGLLMEAYTDFVRDEGYTFAEYDACDFFRKYRRSVSPAESPENV